MVSYRVLLGLFLFAQSQTNTVIIRGKVTMTDGSVPPKQVGIQRLCDDAQGSAPGPLTNKNGEYVWRMDVDPFRVRVCRLEATLSGYASSGIDISNLNGYLSTTTDLPPIVLSLKLDPRVLNTGESDVPSKSISPNNPGAFPSVFASRLSEASRSISEGAGEGVIVIRL